MLFRSHRSRRGLGSFERVKTYPYRASGGIDAEARGDIEKYVGGKKGYKKNKYKYDDRTIRLVEENWGFALKQWDYNL